MVSKKRFFVLTFLILYYSIQNVNAQYDEDNDDKLSPSMQSMSKDGSSDSDPTESPMPSTSEDAPSGSDPTESPMQSMSKDGSSGSDPTEYPMPSTSEDASSDSDPNESPMPSTSEDASSGSDPTESPMPSTSEDAPSGSDPTESPMPSTSKDASSSSDPTEYPMPNTSEDAPNGTSESDTSETENSSGQNGSPEAKKSNDPDSSSFGQDAGSSNTGGNEQSQPESSGSENTSGSNGSPGAENSNGPASSSTEQDPGSSRTKKSRSGMGSSENGVPKTPAAPTAEDPTPEESGENEKSQGEESSTTDFANEPLVYQAVDFALNPIEGVIGIFLRAIRKSGAAAIETGKQITSGLDTFIPQVGQSILQPTKLPNLMSSLASGSASFTSQTASRFGGVALDALKEGRDGLSESASEGGILAKELSQMTGSAAKSGFNSARSGATYGAGQAYKAAKNYLIKDCVWYRVGFTDNCVEFRIWKFAELPAKLTLSTALLPIRISIDAALLPITLPLLAITVPIDLAVDAVKVGGLAAKGTGKGVKLGIEAAPYVVSGTESVAKGFGQLGTRLAYHAGRFTDILV